MIESTAFIDHSPAQPTPATPIPSASNLVLIDNYDSFTWNVYQYLVLEGANVAVFRNDEITLQQLIDKSPTQLVISPGPGHPDTISGISKDAIRHFAGKIPVLGVCMGEQCIFSVFGGVVDETGKILHGKTSPLKHNGKGMYAGLPQDLPVARYHSLAGTNTTIPECLEVTSWTEPSELGDQSVIMGVRHKEYLVEGLQFHPESIMTAEGRVMLRNFLCMQGGTWKDNERFQANATEMTSVSTSNGAVPELTTEDSQESNNMNMFNHDNASSNPTILSDVAVSQQKGVWSKSSPAMNALNQDGKSQQPRNWTSIIRLSDQPWIQSHKVHGAVVYPAAGHLCMVLQAAWQNAITVGNDAVAAYKLRDISFLSPLIIPETDEGIEVGLSFSPERTSSTSQETWSVFSIASYAHDRGWTEHCRGAISVDCKSQLSLLYERHQDMIFDAGRASCENVAPELVYDAFGATGLSYGSGLRGISSLAAGDNQALGAIQVTDTQTRMLKGFESFFQMSIVALSQGDITNLTQPFTPKFIKSIHVSGDFSPAPEQDIQVVAHSDSVGYRCFQSALSAAVQQSNGPTSFVQMDGIELIPMESALVV